MKISLDLLQPDGLWTLKYQHTTYNQEEAFKALHFLIDGERNFFETPVKQAVKVRGVAEAEDFIARDGFWAIKPNIVEAATMGVYETTNNKIEAIKFYRTITGASLKEAKDCVEGMLSAAEEAY